MEKRVELTFNGTLNQGFTVELKLGNEQKFPTTEERCGLPDASDLYEQYKQWQQSYRNLVNGRMQLEEIEVDGTPENRKDRCAKQHKQLVKSFQTWLETDVFKQVRDCLLVKLNSSDSVRVLIRTDEKALHYLPWHDWSLLQRYRLAEIALANTVAEKPMVDKSGISAPVNILAILGDSTNIDTTIDVSLLDTLPDAKVQLLSDTNRKELSQTIRKHPPKMLFFAGHSETTVEESQRPNKGIIHLGDGRSLSLDTLSNGLTDAIDEGLELAMFNSCDGLGLAYDLAPLGMPVMILMREPVSDPVAHRFLQTFLEKFSEGNSLYVAVRKAREQLFDEFEEDIPGVSGLPIIWQNPLVEPFAWPQPVKPKKLWQSVLSSLGIALLVIGIRYLGYLQPLELMAYDQLMRMRPAELPDSRFLIVKVTEEDVHNQPESERSGSLSDRSLEKLLEVLQQGKPRVIGLDIYRDYPVRSGFPKLSNMLRTSENLVSVCKTAVLDEKEISPPPEVSKNALGFSNGIQDPDLVQRRQLLAQQSPAGRCVPSYALNVELALRYLDKQGIQLSFIDERMWQLGAARFKRLALHQGFYHRSSIDMRGHNFRKPHH